MQLSTFTQLLLFKTKANLRAEISRYYLNYLWWGIEPILSMIVLYIVFGIMLNRGTEHYVAFLLSGVIWWNWFSRSVQNASGSVLGGKSLMMQMDIPKIFFPLEVCLRDAFKQLFVTLILLSFLFIYPTPVSVTWLALPILVLIQFTLILGVATFCAAIVPFIPDLKFIIGTGLNLMFFGSGIFFRIEDVVLPQHQFILYMNPMAGLLKNYRSVLIYDQWPDWIYLGKVGISCLILCFISFRLLHKLDKIYPRVCNQ